MTLQILHYDFLGPAHVSEWKPPMEDTVYVLLGRSRDRFTVVYVGECKSTSKVDYLTQNPLFGRWVRAAGGERNLYICLHQSPDDAVRARIVSRIASVYKPECNADG